MGYPSTYLTSDDTEPNPIEGQPEPPIEEELPSDDFIDDSEEEEGQLEEAEVVNRSYTLKDIPQPSSLASGVDVDVEDPELSTDVLALFTREDEELELPKKKKPNRKKRVKANKTNFGLVNLANFSPKMYSVKSALSLNPGQLSSMYSKKLRILPGPSRKGIAVNQIKGA